MKVLDFGLARLLALPAAARAHDDQAGHRSAGDSRHAALHVAGAGPRRAGDERQRRVLVRRRSLRARDGHAPVRVGVNARNALRHRFTLDSETDATAAGRARRARAASAPHARKTGNGAPGRRRSCGGADEALRRDARCRPSRLVDRPHRRAARSQSAAAAHAADWTNHRAGDRQEPAARSGSSAADADGARWDGEDAPGRPGRRRFGRGIRGRRLVRQPGADRRSEAGGIGRGPRSRRA